MTSYKKKVTSLKNVTRITKGIKDTVKNLTDFIESTIYDPWSVNPAANTIRTIIKNTQAVWDGVQKIERMNVLGIIVCSLAFGIALSRLGSEGQAMIKLFEVMMKVVMSLVHAVMW